MLRLGRRDYDGAWDDQIACHQLGRIVGRGPSIVDCLIAVAIDGVAERADLALLDAIKSDTKRLQKCLGDLQKLPPVPEIADKVNLCERYTQLEMLMTIDRDSEKFLKSLSTVISLSYAFSDTFGGSAWPTNEKDRTKLVNLISDLIGKDLDWDPALRNVNEWFDQVVKLSNVKCRTQREKKWDKINEKVEALKKKLLSGSLQLTLEDAKVGSGAKGKFISGIWLCWVIPGAQKVQNATDRAKQTQDILCLAFALAWYHCDHGSYPKTLDVLAPKYLANVPRDMFSDKPLIYRPSDKGYLLYSVGVNGKDEGGRDYTFEPRGDDLAIRMPLPEWKPY